MILADYLRRIGYSGSLAPSIETLRGVHRAHLMAIPYENLDIHLGRRLELEPARMFAKIVYQRRGGWCYEMNGLLAWALRELGFNVRFLAGAVNRHLLGDEALKNHLLIRVDLDQPYLADVGFGDGFLEPLPLQPGTYRQKFLEFRLTQEGEWWTLHNHPQGGATGFDFTLEPRELGDFAARCHEQQTSPSSGFVQTTICQRFTEDGIVTLRGAVQRTITESGALERIIETEAGYAECLAREFGLELGGLGSLWNRVWERHLAWLNRSRLVE